MTPVDQSVLAAEPVADRLALSQAAIADFCCCHSIRKLSLFGSVLRSDFGPESDVDVLVEFEPGARIHFFKFVEIQDALTRLLKRTVDLHTPNSLNPHFRAKVMQTARVIYERTGRNATA
jgi:hypothetical protein